MTFTSPVNDRDSSPEWVSPNTVLSFASWDDSHFESHALCNGTPLYYREQPSSVLLNTILDIPSNVYHLHTDINFEKLLQLLLDFSITDSPEFLQLRSNDFEILNHVFELCYYHIDFTTVPHESLNQLLLLFFNLTPGFCSYHGCKFSIFFSLIRKISCFLDTKHDNDCFFCLNVQETLIFQSFPSDLFLSHPFSFISIIACVDPKISVFLSQILITKTANVTISHIIRRFNISFFKDRFYLLVYAYLILFGLSYSTVCNSHQYLFDDLITSIKEKSSELLLLVKGEHKSCLAIEILIVFEKLFENLSNFYPKNDLLKMS
ncbi:hypothetical protein P9112_005902 [Eukaryota sp. TZLM1-RC]